MMCANLIPINQTATTGYNVGGPWTLGVGGLWPSHLLFPPERSCKMDPPIQCYHVRASPPPYSYFVRPWSDDHYNAIYLFFLSKHLIKFRRATLSLPYQATNIFEIPLPQLNGTLLRLSLRKSLRQLKENTKFLNNSNLKLNHK